MTVWHHWNTEKFKFDFIKNLAPLCKAIALDSNPHFKIKKCDKVPTNYNCVSCMLVCNHTALWTILCQKPQKSFKKAYIIGLCFGTKFEISRNHHLIVLPIKKCWVLVLKSSNSRKVGKKSLSTESRISLVKIEFREHDNFLSIICRIYETWGISSTPFPFNFHFLVSNVALIATRMATQMLI